MKKALIEELPMKKSKNKGMQWKFIDFEVRIFLFFYSFDTYCHLLKTFLPGFQILRNSYEKFWVI